jgi:hypothetical protein
MFLVCSDALEGSLSLDGPASEVSLYVKVGLDVRCFECGIGVASRFDCI